MVKILGTNGKVIITILYVYYWEINAGVTNGNNIPQEGEKGIKRDVLEVWKQNPAFNLRRAATTRSITPDLKNGKATFRHKSTKGIRVEIGHSVPKHIPRNGHPHLEPINMRQNYNQDGDEYDPYEKTFDKSNLKKNHEMNKTHNKMDKRHSDKSYTADHKGTVNDYNDDEDKYKKSKHHKSQDSILKNSKAGKENGKNEDKDDIRYSHDKKHQKDKHLSPEKYPHGSDKNDKYSSLEQLIHLKKEKVNDLKPERHHKNNKTQTNDKHDINTKHKGPEKLVDHHVDQKHHSDEKQNNAKHVSSNKSHNKNKQQDDHDNQNKHKYSKDKDKSHLHHKGHTQTRATKARESNWPIHHHRAKLRTHQEHVALRSTRMTPMYLMQQPPEDQVTEGKKPDVDQPEQVPTYLTPYALTSQMTRIMEEFTEANVTIEVLGRTVEYNDIVLVKMTERKNDNKFFRAEESKYMDEVPEKKIIFIVHGLSVMGIKNLAALIFEPSLKKLISYYVAHLKLFDIYLMPMANPDGYSAVQTSPHWNKNMSPQDACPGVALDRNFDVAWNSSKKLSSCSQMFPGKAAFSETETKAVRDVFHYHGHKILAYIHVHAGTCSSDIFKGDAILYPRGFTEVQSDDDKYIDLKGEIDEAMKNASFQVLSVTVDTLYNWYGKVAGSSVDYAATVYGIPYALEFVMQLYSDDDDLPYSENALNEIWSRLIRTSFKNMYKSLRANEVQKRK